MTTRQLNSNIVSGVIGGLVAVVIGAILIATGAVGSGKTKTVVEQTSLASGNAAVAQQKQGGGLTINQIYNHAKPGVAFVQAKVTQKSPSLFGLPDQQQGISSGSGFVLDPRGYIVTNAHVVQGADPGTVQVSFGNGQPTHATIVGNDVSSDVAVLKVDPSSVKLAPLALGDSSKLAVGDPVVAIGNPFGYDDTVTQGIVSALQRHIQAPNNFSIDNVVQTDAAINPGNSGGPLLDSKGRVIGVNSQIATNGGSNGSVGIGFAIPINLVKTVAPQLIKSGSIKHAYIGITTTTVSAQLAHDLHLHVPYGALVQNVVSGGPADKAGMRAGSTQTADGINSGGDQIVAINGKTVHTADDIASIIGGFKPGQQVDISFYRGSSRKTVTVTLGNRPTSAPPGTGPNGGGGQAPFPLP